MSFDWSDEAVATLRRMFFDGASDAEIGAAIGTGRLSVLGKRQRLGLKHERAAKAVTRSIESGRAARARVQSPAPEPDPDDRPSAPIVQPPASFRPQASAAPERACTLLHLDLFRSCKWPISPPQVAGADILFCAAAREAGSSYCPTHRALSGARQRTEAERERDARAAEAMARGRQRAGRERMAG